MTGKFDLCAGIAPRTRCFNAQGEVFYLTDLTTRTPIERGTKNHQPRLLISSTFPTTALKPSLNLFLHLKLCNLFLFNPGLS